MDVWRDIDDKSTVSTAPNEYSCSHLTMDPLGSTVGSLVLIMSLVGQMECLLLIVFSSRSITS